MRDVDYSFNIERISEILQREETYPESTVEACTMFMQAYLMKEMARPTEGTLLRKYGKTVADLYFIKPEVEDP